MTICSSGISTIVSCTTPLLPSRIELKEDLESLGIDAVVGCVNKKIDNKISPIPFTILFRNQEDLNLYKMSGKYKQNELLSFGLDWLCED